MDPGGIDMAEAGNFQLVLWCGNKASLEHDGYCGNPIPTSLIGLIDVWRLLVVFNA